MTSIVLVPGAWLGGWAWESVTEPLRTGGHDVHPVTLAGLAERADAAGPEVDLDTHTEDLVRLIENLSQVVLVAHSYGGFPATAAAQRLPDRITRLVYVDSGPPPDGVSQLDLQEPAEQQRMRAQVGESGLLPPPVWDPERDPLQAGLDEPAVTLLRQRSTPHPFGSWTQPIRRTGPETSAIKGSASPTPPLPPRRGNAARRQPLPPAALIACAIPLDQVRELIGAGHPVFAELAGAELRELPTGHWPMFSEPDRLAELLDELAVRA